MLTSMLPPSPVVDGDDASAVDEEEEDDENCAGRVVVGYSGSGEDGWPVGIGGRQPMFHTKSDTNTLQRFADRSEAPSVAAALSSSTTMVLHNSPCKTETSGEWGGLLLSVSGPGLNGKAGKAGTQSHQPNISLTEQAVIFFWQPCGSSYCIVHIFNWVWVPIEW